MSAMRRLSLSAVLSIGGVLAIGVSGAMASTVTRTNLFPISNGTALTIADSSGEAPGEVNNIRVGIAPDHPNDYRITDTAGIKDPLPPGCVRESATSIRCPVNTFFPELGELPVVEIVVLLGGMNDTFGETGSGIPNVGLLTVEGGSGNDHISGRTSVGQEEIDGGKGDDIIRFSAVSSDIKNYFGNDGNDQIFYGGVALEPPDPFVEVNALAVAAKSDPGAKVVGGNGNDKLTGGPDNDKLNGGAGKDKLRGAAGKDKLKCGGGKDSAVGGGGKDSAKGCENEKGIE